MTDVNRFIEQIGDDVSATYVPSVQAFVQKVGQDIAASTGPKVGQFINQLVKDVFAQESGPIQEFLTKLIKDLTSRYHPELSGNLTTRIIDNGLELESTDTKLVVKNRATGAAIATLDVPVFVRVHLNDFFVKIESASVKIKDPQLG